MKTSIQTIVIAIILLAIITGCASNNQVIKVGVITPLSGEAASYGQSAKEGLDLAAMEINNQGGVLGKQIELVYEDSQADPKIATSIASRLINVEHVSYIIVADGSGATTAIAPMADQTKTIMIGTLGSTPELKYAGEYFFRTIPSDSAQGYALAEYAESQGLNRVAVLYVNDPYGVGLLDSFGTSFNGTIVASESFASGSLDVRTQLLKIRDENPDGILLVVRNEMPAVMRQIRELGITAEIMASETAKNQALVDAAGSDAEGLVTVYFAEQEGYPEYVRRFEDTNGHLPPQLSEYSYDCIYALASAIKNADSLNNTLVMTAMHAVSFKGASGRVGFDEYGEVLPGKYLLFIVRNGTFEQNV
ncbi:MAG: ABC transporter substrate-binding protein [Candidatus Woesearchaeota archaeon]